MGLNPISSGTPIMTTTNPLTSGAPATTTTNPISSGASSSVAYTPWWGLNPTPTGSWISELTPNRSSPENRLLTLPASWVLYSFVLGWPGGEPDVLKPLRDYLRLTPPFFPYQNARPVVSQAAAPPDSVLLAQTGTTKLDGTGTPPPARTDPLPAYERYWTNQMLGVRYHPTADERALLDMVVRYGAPWFDAGLDKGWLPREMLPEFQDLWTNPRPFSVYLPYVVNQETITQAADNYPWPGPKRFFWKAFMEARSDLIRDVALRITPPLPTEEEFRTAITLGLMSDWDRIAQRVEALTASWEKRQERRMKMRGAAMAAVAAVASIALPVLAAAAIGAAIKMASAADKARAAQQAAEFASSFEEGAPAFAAEVKRVAELLSPITDATAAGADVSAGAGGSWGKWLLGIGAAAAGLLWFAKR
jgi:hypothetical protein